MAPRASVRPSVHQLPRLLDSEPWTSAAQRLALVRVHFDPVPAELLTGGVRVAAQHLFDEEGTRLINIDVVL